MCENYGRSRYSQAWIDYTEVLAGYCRPNLESSRCGESLCICVVGRCTMERVYYMNRSRNCTMYVGVLSKDVIWSHCVTVPQIAMEFDITTRWPRMLGHGRGPWPALVFCVTLFAAGASAGGFDCWQCLWREWRGNTRWGWSERCWWMDRVCSLHCDGNRIGSNCSTLHQLGLCVPVCTDHDDSCEWVPSCVAVETM